MSKAKFAAQTINLAMQLGQVNRLTKDLIEVYTDRNYGTTDPLTEADINAIVPGYLPNDTPLTLAQFNELAGLLVELTNFMTNVAVTAVDRELIINKYRNDL